MTTTFLAILLAVVLIYALMVRKMYKSAQRNVNKFYRKYESECEVTEDLKAENLRLKHLADNMAINLSRADKEVARLEQCCAKLAEYGKAATV